MKDLLTAFRKELLKATNRMADDDLHTTSEVESLIKSCYGRAKKQCEPSEDVSLEDE